MKIIQTKSIKAKDVSEDNSELVTFLKERTKLHKNLKQPSFCAYINEYAWDAFLSHSKNVYDETGHEAQGIFTGKYYKDAKGYFVYADKYFEGTGESSKAYVGMSEQCLSNISNECDKDSSLMLIWIHTHPNFGVFYSGTDVKCLKNNFFKPHQIGIVADIIREQTKGYKVNNGDVDEFDAFYIINEGDSSLYIPYSKNLKKKDIETLQYGMLVRNIENIEISLNNLTERISHIEQITATIPINDSEGNNEESNIHKIIEDLKLTYTKDLIEIKKNVEENTHFVSRVNWQMILLMVLLFIFIILSSDFSFSRFF